MKECVTHHHACDCREAAFAELLREVMRTHADKNSSEYNECDKARCNWCERASVLIGEPDK